MQRPIISSKSAEHLIDSADGKDGLRKGIYITSKSSDKLSTLLLHRAAERYADVTPEELMRRRERGWGDTHQDIVN